MTRPLVSEDGVREVLQGLGASAATVEAGVLLAMTCSSADAQGIMMLLLGIDYKLGALAERLDRLEK